MHFLNLYVLSSPTTDTLLDKIIMNYYPFSLTCIVFKNGRNNIVNLFIKNNSFFVY